MADQDNSRELVLRVNAQLADPRFTELEWRVTAFKERDVSKAFISVVAIGFPDNETAIICSALGGVDEWPRVVTDTDTGHMLAVPAPPQWFDHAVSVMLLSVEEGTLNV